MQDIYSLEGDVVMLQYGLGQLMALWPGGHQSFDKTCVMQCIQPAARLSVSVLQHLSRQLGKPDVSTFPRSTDSREAQLKLSDYSLMVQYLDNKDSNRTLATLTRCCKAAGAMATGAAWDLQSV
jgi:hypothetical protein